MSFVELTAANGAKVSVNPETVVLITDAADAEGRTILGNSMVFFIGAPPMPISAPRTDVQELLEGGVVL